MSSSREAIREKLLERKRELEEGLQRLQEDRASVEAENVQDPLDQAIKSSIEDLSIMLEENEREEYNRILRVLHMIDVGTYGTCSDCSRPISEKRLELYPYATRCIACQELRENT